MTSEAAKQRFRAIVPPLLDDAYTLAKWLTRSAADAEDVVQEAAVRALNALENAAVEKPRAWFMRIVRNTALTWVAKNRPSALRFAGDANDLDLLSPTANEDRAATPEDQLIAQEDGERLRDAIAALPSPLLETLVMRDIDGLNYRDIAEATEAPIGTVMSRLSRARAALAKILRATP